MHRDYRSSSDSIVKVFNNKVEFYNPGRLPDNITVEDLLSNNYKSTPRNKQIADFCKSLDLIEKYGSGIRRIIDYFKTENLPKPEFRNISDGFMVTIFGNEKDDVTKDVTKEDRAGVIIELIGSKPGITIDEIAELLNLTRRTVSRELKQLKIQKRINRNGGRKSGFWQIVQ